MFANSKLQKVKEHLLPVRKKMVTEEVDEDSECGGGKSHGDERDA